MSAIASNILLASGSVRGVEQSTSADATVNSQPQNQLSENAKLAIVGITMGFATGLTIAGFIYKNKKKRRARQIQSSPKIDRFREEFLCGPLANHYLSNSETNISQTNSPADLTTPTTAEIEKPTREEINNFATESPTPLPESYQELINEIVATALSGQIRSKEYIYRQLVEKVSSGSGEIFERCLSDRLHNTQSELDNITSSTSFFERETPELKKARLNRTLKALQTIQGEWERFQKQKLSQAAVTAAVAKILNNSENSRLEILLTIIDPNQNQVFSKTQLQQLAQQLIESAEAIDEPSCQQEIQHLATGISRGLTSYQQLEGSLVRWIYEPTQTPLGLNGSPLGQDPWACWATQVDSPLPQLLFYLLSHGASAIEAVVRQPYIDIKEWVELAVILQIMQQGLVTWFEKQPYDSKWGTSASITTFLSFAVVWCELSNGFYQANHLPRHQAEELAKVCFQITLQILRTFACREYFPLYGGVFAFFGRDSLEDAINYLDTPLREVAATQEKARILTLLGYSQRVLGKYEQAISFHQEALEIARQAGDQPCEIANLNHLSRICVGQKDYTQAINYSQRALILARQAGDRLGEAHALASLGYGELFVVREMSEIEPDVYERAIEYLERGLQLSNKLTDAPFGNNLSARQTQALCYNGLGIANLALKKYPTAIEYLEKGTEAVQFSGDKYLHGLNFLYLAESYYNINNLESAIYNSCLGMYLLQAINAIEWQQAEGLIKNLLVQIGYENVLKNIAKYRADMIKYIAVDGYDYLVEWLERYQRSQ